MRCKRTAPPYCILLSVSRIAVQLSPVFRSAHAIIGCSPSCGPTVSFYEARCASMTHRLRDMYGYTCLMTCSRIYSRFSRSSANKESEAARYSRIDRGERVGGGGQTADAIGAPGTHSTGCTCAPASSVQSSRFGQGAPSLVIHSQYVLAEAVKCHRREHSWNLPLFAVPVAGVGRFAGAPRAGDSACDRLISRRRRSRRHRRPRRCR